MVTAYKIADWFDRYEVNKDGRPAKPGDELRPGPLQYIRDKVYAHHHSTGFRKLSKLAHSRTMEVNGIFDRLRQIAGNHPLPLRDGTCYDEKGRIPTIEQLAFIVGTTPARMEYAIAVLTQIEWVIAENCGKPQATAESAGASRIQGYNQGYNQSTVKDQNISQIFDHWNSFKGKGKWKSHRELNHDIRSAIAERLKTYTAKEIIQAISNYALILLGKEYTWTYAWTLRQFLTRHQKPPNGKDLQLLRFLSGEFYYQDYIRPECARAVAAEQRKDYEQERQRDKARRENTEWLKQASSVDVTGFLKRCPHLKWLVDEVRKETEND